MFRSILQYFCYVQQKLSLPISSKVLTKKFCSFFSNSCKVLFRYEKIFFWLFSVFEIIFVNSLFQSIFHYLKKLIQCYLQFNWMPKLTNHNLPIRTSFNPNVSQPSNPLMVRMSPPVLHPLASAGTSQHPLSESAPVMDASQVQWTFHFWNYFFNQVFAVSYWFIFKANVSFLNCFAEENQKILTKITFAQLIFTFRYDQWYADQYNFITAYCFVMCSNNHAACVHTM